MSAIKAQGTTLKFTPVGGEELTVGKLSAVGEIQPDSEELDITTLESPEGCREYMQGMRDCGEIEISGFHDAGDAGQRALRAAYASGENAAFCVCFPDGTQARFSAFVKSHTLGAAEVDGAVGFGAVLRVSGPLSVQEAN